MMRLKAFTRCATLSVLTGALLLSVPVNFNAASSSAPAAAPQANLGINGFFAADKAQRGRTIQAAVVVDIPGGYHVNANKPLGKYAIPTVLKIEAPGGVRISPISYPRASVRRFSFSDEQLAVYEGRAVLRFNITIPSNFDSGVTELRARLRYQSCTEDTCFQPVTREITMPIAVVGANESVKRINGQLFGGRRRTKG
ncbi:MAG TPA: protein-disulfide reductase DsbD N-terminal domain-containing protein [Pyrinomonadaceae bacterium]|jgi:DsbC/DsbD-like thiol-disulfide interchange protein|nr:protein-disulfide reductase DsbD N-terminal domain-containing protein [Pyrinomonadaceae bacterium]